MTAEPPQTLHLSGHCVDMCVKAPKVLFRLLTDLANQGIVLKTLNSSCLSFESAVATIVAEDWVHDLYIPLVDDIDGICDERVTQISCRPTRSIRRRRLTGHAIPADKKQT